MWHSFLEIFQSVGFKSIIIIHLIIILFSFIKHFLPLAFRLESGLISLIDPTRLAGVVLLISIVLCLLMTLVSVLLPWEKFISKANLHDWLPLGVAAISIVFSILLIRYSNKAREFFGVGVKLFYLKSSGNLYGDNLLVAPLLKNNYLPKIFWIVQKEGDTEKIIRNLTSAELGPFELKSKVDDFETKRILAKVYGDPLNY